MNQKQEELSYSEIDETVLNALDRPGWGYWMVITLLSLGALTGLICWGIQVFKGIMVTSQNNFMMWGVYTTLYLYWISIAQAGILISCVFRFQRPLWRTPMIRIAETMTALSIFMACMFPFVHLGRLWMTVYMLPVSSETPLGLNFKSPLVFDLVILGVFLMVGVALWVLGLLPDLAVVRDRAGGIYKKIFTKLALSWNGRVEQWRDYSRGYLILACFGFPLAVSSHLSMAWNFNLNGGSDFRFFVLLLYFISSSICSGLSFLLFMAMAVRKAFGFERIIRPDTPDHVIKILVYSALWVAVFRWISVFNFPETHMALESAVQNPAGPGPDSGFWVFWIINTILPLFFLFKQMRSHAAGLIGVSLVIHIGLWAERSLMMMGRSNVHFFEQLKILYGVSFIETGITVGCFSLFFLFFLLFVKHFPVISLTETKDAVFQGKPNET